MWHLQPLVRKAIVFVAWYAVYAAKPSFDTRLTSALSLRFVMYSLRLIIMHPICFPVTLVSQYPSRFVAFGGALRFPVHSHASMHAVVNFRH